MPQEKSERRILKLSGNMHVINLDASGKAIEEEREEVSDHIVLPWHCEAAHKAITAVSPEIASMRDNPDWHPRMYGQRLDDVSTIIANHDQHAETLRLLDEIRAHLAAMSQSAKQEGTQ